MTAWLPCARLATLDMTDLLTLKTESTAGTGRKGNSNWNFKNHSFMKFFCLIIILYLAYLAIPKRREQQQTPDGRTEDGYFIYKGIPVRKCRQLIQDDDGNYLVDGTRITVAELEKWFHKLNP